MPGATTVVYLAGFGRSGSTLVERVLAAASGWTTVGELVDLPRSVAHTDERCGCGEAFSVCPFWAQVGDLAFGGWSEAVIDDLDGLQRAAARQRHLPGMLLAKESSSAALTELRSAYARLYRAVATVAQAEVVVDSSKGPAFGQALAGAPGIDLRILNLVRDPRAVAWSWNRQVERPHVTSGTEQMWRIPARRAAAQWSALQLEVEAMSRLGRVPSTRLRYEDFVLDPVGSLVEATSALGIPLDAGDLPPVVEGRVQLEPSHGLSGNPSRFRSGAVVLRRDEAWRSAMPARDRRVVTALTLPLLAAYGYPTTSWPTTYPAPTPSVTPEPRTRRTA